MKENTFWHTPQLRSFQIHSKTICKAIQESLWFILYSFMKMIFRSIRSLSSMDILIMSIAAFAQFVCGKNMILSSKFYIYYPDNAGGDLHIGRNHLSHACFNLPVQVNCSNDNLSLPIYQFVSLSIYPASKSIYQLTLFQFTDWEPKKHFQQSAHSTCCSDPGQLVRRHGNLHFI